MTELFRFKKYFLFVSFIGFSLLIYSQKNTCGEKLMEGNSKDSIMEKNLSEKYFPVQRSEAEWRKNLDEMQYHVLREKGTEKALSGKYYDHKEKGVYTCAACGFELFQSESKYDSGSGWPSFYSPVADSAVGETLDKSFGMTRTEVHCNNCGSHLGHVFPDGPYPTGLRYCINSVSLDFESTPIR